MIYNSPRLAGEGLGERSSITALASQERGWGRGHPTARVI